MEKRSDNRALIETPLRQVWLRADVLVASFGINLLGVVLPIVILQVYDRVLRYQSEATLYALAALAGGAVSGEFALRYLRSRILNEAGARYEHRQHLALMDRLLNANCTRYEAKTSSEYYECFRALSQLRNHFAQRAPVLIADFPFLIIFAILIAAIGGWLVLVPLVVMGLVLLSAKVIAQELNRSEEERDGVDKLRFNFLTEVLQGILTLKASSMETALSRRYERLHNRSALLVSKISGLTIIAQSATTVLSQAATVCLVALGAPMVISGQMSLGGLAATTMLTGRMFQPVVRGVTAWTRSQAIESLRGKLADVFALPAQSTAEEELGDLWRGDLKLENVSFSYDPDGPDMLHNVNLDAPHGAMIGLVGESGSGKSTLLELIAGRLQPNEGSITISGRSLEEFNPRSLSEDIGYLPSEGALFSGTLLENAALFREGPARLRSIQLLKVLGLANYIARLNDGLDTRIEGANINAIPGGVRQALAIARVLALNPKIILFDNANNSLDTESDRRLLAYLSRLKGKRTIIMATQRPSYLSQCDRVLILEDGALRESKEHSKSLGAPATPSLPNEGGKREAG